MIDFLAQLLYPKRCVRCRKAGDYICASCFAGIAFLEHQFCGMCQKGTIDGMTHPKCLTKYGIDGIFSAISYRGIVKKLLYQFKYSPYLSDLKGVLGRLLCEGITQQEAFMHFLSGDICIIVPVPLHKARERMRGYNQSFLLAKELSIRLRIPSINALVRKIPTKPQFELKREERTKNIVNAFVVPEKFKEKIKGKNIILVDDITTTGATLRECAKILKKSGARRVIGITLAHEG